MLPVFVILLPGPSVVCNYTGTDTRHPTRCKSLYQNTGDLLSSWYCTEFYTMNWHNNMNYMNAYCYAYDILALCIRSVAFRSRSIRKRRNPAHYCSQCSVHGSEFRVTIALFHLRNRAHCHPSLFALPITGEIKSSEWRRTFEKSKVKATTIVFFTAHCRCCNSPKTDPKQNNVGT